jgi:2'-5' RNA ligase
MPPPLRLFVAAYPPLGLAESMLEELGRLAPPPGRRVPAAQVHLTLQFIGDRGPQEIDEVIEAIERSVSGLPAFTLHPQRMITLPERGPARLVALETDAPPPLLELASRLARRFAQPSRRRPHDRYLPHLTLMRFRSPARMDRWNVQTELSPFVVSEIRLMKSRLSPDGAIHEAVRSFAAVDR